MPRLHHAALWTGDLDRLASFYASWFLASEGPRYRNEAKRFSSVFLRLESGAQIEPMRRDGLEGAAPPDERIGYAHLAFSLGSEGAVRSLTDAMRAAAVPIVGEPRWTGDGFFESAVLDPDGNRIELTI